MRIYIEKFANLIGEIKEKLLFIYFIFFSLRSFINLTLQCIYVHQRRFLDYSSKLEIGGKASLKINKIQDLMLTIGQPHREISTSGIFFYSAQLYSCVIFYLICTCSRGKYMNYIRKDGFLSFLQDPAKEHENISIRLNSLIKNLIDSNINYTRIIFGFQTLKRPNKFKYSDQRYGKKKSDEFNSHILARERSMNTLTLQLKYLNQLKSNSSRIWPPNRACHWAKHLKILWTTLFITTYIVTWIIFIVCTLVSINIAHKTLIKSSLNDSYAKFNLLDRLWSSDMILYCSYGPVWYLGPLSVAVIGVYDQFKYINSFESRSLYIISRFQKLNLYLSRKNSVLSENKNPTVAMDGLNSEKLIQDLKIECDNAAIEFYITYRLFRYDLQITLELIRKSLDLYVSVIILCLVTTFSFYDQVPNEQLPVILFGSLAMVSGINGVFIFSAALHASSCRITNLIWSMITQAERCNINYYLDQSVDACAPDPYPNLGVSSSMHAANRSDLKDCFSNFDFEYHSRSLMNPHTVLLLRQILSNHTYLARDCVCRLYGSVALNFNGILRINFWLVSSVLLVLTYFG